MPINQKQSIKLFSDIGKEKDFCCMEVIFNLRLTFRMKFSASLKSDFGQELVIEFREIPRPKERGHFRNYWIGNDLRIENSGFEERSIRRIEENLAGIGADAFGKADGPFFATIVHLHKKAGVGWRMAIRRLGQNKKAGAQLRDRQDGAVQPKFNIHPSRMTGIT